MSDNNLQDDVADQLEQSFEVPEKYKGKTTEDVIRMHMEAEKERSRLGNEVGTLRSMADQLMGLQQAKTEQTRKERKPITTDELLTNPDESIERALADNPVLAKTQEHIKRLELSLAQSQFEREFPEYMDDLGNPEFANWIKTNKVRTALGVAANSGDYEAASSLWSLWKERQSDLESTKQTKKELRKKEERLGTLEGSGTQGMQQDKVYKRLDFMELQRKALSGDPEAKAKWNDPNFQQERLRAYADKRVK